MTYYAVIDTNVIVSAMLKADSVPGLIVKYVDSGVIIPLVNEEILSEYYQVINGNKFGFSEFEINKLFNGIKEKAITLTRQQTLEEFIHKDDIVFFEIVMSARQRMDAYLITGNIRHYPVRNYVVTPRQMLEIINKTNNQ